MARKTKEQISYNMSRVRNKDTKLENIFCAELVRRGLTTFVRNNTPILGKPTSLLTSEKLLLFVTVNFGTDMIGKIQR